MRLHDLLAGLDAFEVRGDPDVDVRAIAHDSRSVTPGAMFACIPGQHVDGHEFAGAAVANGATSLLVERGLDVAATQVRVASVRAFLGPIASRVYGEPSLGMHVLGVTGTNGKTTTTYLLESIVRAAERVAVIGTIGARLDGEELESKLTTPEATDLQALLSQLWKAGAATVAMEVSSHALEQHRVDGTRFAAVCFTNLTHDHLDYHGTIDAYFEAKARLFSGEFSSQGAVNLDDERGPGLVKRAEAAGMTVVTYALDQPADVGASDVDVRADRSLFTLSLAGVRVPVRSALVGRFNVVNCLAAAATAYAAGIDVGAIARGLSAPVVVPGRMERVEATQPFTVLVDYAHTPDALASVLDAARALAEPPARLIVVFGCGGDRDRTKRPLMGAVATRRSDVALLTSDNPRSEDPAAIARDVLAGIDDDVAPPIVELDRRLAIRAALHEARPGDVVVIAGKGHETGQTAGGVTTPFDDQVVAREELEARV